MPFFESSSSNKFTIDFDFYKPVKVIFCCEADGKITPMRFKVSLVDDTEESYNIDSITQTKDIPGGVSFRCGISHNGLKQYITLVYYYDDHIWVTPC